METPHIHEEAAVVLVVPTVTGVSPAAGLTTGGTVATITGTSFVGATAVTFGGTAATAFTVNSNTQITATTPPRPAGSAQVRVSTPGGTSTNAVFFNYQALPAAPTVTSVNPGSGPTVGGTTVTITGTDLTGATAVTFSGTAATAFTVNSNTQITATTPARPAGPAQVVVVTPGGTSNALSYAYTSAPAITGLSPAQGPETGGNGVTITGSNLTFTSTVTFGGTGAPFVVLSPTQIAATAPPGIGTVLVSVASPGGNSGTLPYTYIPAPQI